MELINFIKKSVSYRTLSLTIAYLLLYMSISCLPTLLGQGEAITGLWRLPAGLTVFGIIAFGWIGVALDAIAYTLTLLLLAVLQESVFSVHHLAAIPLHTAAYAMAILPLHRHIRSLAFLNRPAQVGGLLIAAGLGAALASALHLIWFGWATSTPLDPLWLKASTRMMGEFIAIITLVPLLLTQLLPWLPQYPQETQEPLPAPLALVERQKPSLTQLLIYIAVIGLILVMASTLPINNTAFHYPFLVLLALLPPLVWISTVSGIRQASIAVFVLIAGLMWLAAAEEEWVLVVEYQWAAILITAIGLLLGSSAEACRQAQTTAQMYAERLQQEVAIKTQDLQMANQELVLKENYLRTLVGNAPIGIAQFDDKGQCCYLNELAHALIGHDKNAEGRHFLDFVHPEDRDYVEFMWQTNTSEPKTNSLEFRLKNNDNWVSARWLSLMESTTLSPVSSIVILTDITEQRRKDEQIWTQAHYDMLTSLPNRNLFWERLNQALRRAKRHKTAVALLWIDLDGFKAINDRFGHATGDALLQQVAMRLNGRMRDSDTVARMGGDEFTAILPDVGNREAAIGVAMDLLKRLAEPFSLKTGFHHISASIGLALYPLHTDTPEVLVKYADMTMYAAKNAGKNQVREWQNFLYE